MHLENKTHTHWSISLSVWKHFAWTSKEYKIRSLHWKGTRQEARRQLKLLILVKTRVSTFFFRVSTLIQVFFYVVFNSENRDTESHT